MIVEENQKTLANNAMFAFVLYRLYLCTICMLYLYKLQCDQSSQAKVGGADPRKKFIGKWGGLLASSCQKKVIVGHFRLFQGIAGAFPSTF